MSRKLKFLLIVSLCLNIFLLGFVAGEVRRLIHPQRLESNIIIDFMKEHKEEVEALNAERNKALRMLGKKEFNEERFAVQVEKMGVMQDEMYKKFAFAMAKKLRAMPEAERNEVLKKIKEKRERWQNRMK